MYKRVINLCKKWQQVVQRLLFVMFCVSWAPYPSGSMVLKAGPGLSSAKCFVSKSTENHRYVPIQQETHRTGLLPIGLLIFQILLPTSGEEAKIPLPSAFDTLYPVISRNGLNVTGKVFTEFGWFGLHWLTEVSMWSCGREKSYYCRNFIWGLLGPTLSCFVFNSPVPLLSVTEHLLLTFFYLCV